MTLPMFTQGYVCCFSNSYTVHGAAAEPQRQVRPAQARRQASAVVLQAAAQPGSEAEAQQALAAAIESHETQEMCLTHLGGSLMRRIR